jgi:predicted esterase
MNDVFTPPDRGPTTTPAAGAIAIAGLTFNTPRAGRPPVIMFGGTNDTTVPYNTQVDNCNTANSVGDACDFVSYQGAGHEIGITQFSDIMARAHKFVFERILLAKGYTAVQMPPQAAAA